MGLVFGKKAKPSKVTEQDKAILQLKQQRDKMTVYQRKVEQQMEKDRIAAKSCLANGRKDKAMLLLRKKKFQETLLDKTDSQLENIERMVHDLEFAQIEVKVIEGLKKGNEALNQIHKMLSIDDVEQILDETKEAVAYQQEIDNLLAGGLTAEDEASVEEELENLLQESTNLPDVPTDDLPSKLPQKTKDKTTKTKVLVEE